MKPSLLPSPDNIREFSFPEPSWIPIPSFPEGSLEVRPMRLLRMYGLYDSPSKGSRESSAR